MVTMRVGVRRVVLDLGPQPLDVDVERLGVADVVGPHTRSISVSRVSTRPALLEQQRRAARTP